MTATRRITRRIERAEPGWVFTRFDFRDVGSPHLVGMALLRLVRAGRIRRVGRGIYDSPRTHPDVGPLRPAADAIAQAIARRDGATIQPSEAMAANLLGLTEQVPARVVYETDGRSRTVRVGSRTIQFRRRSPRQVGRAAPTSRLVFSAFRSLGCAHVTTARIAHLRERLSAKDRRKLIADLPLAPAWMHSFLRYIADEPEPGRKRRETRR